MINISDFSTTYNYLIIGRHELYTLARLSVFQFLYLKAAPLFVSGRLHVHYYMVKTRVFGKLLKIYTWVLKGVTVTFRSNISIATRPLHPRGVELKPLYKHPLYTLIFTVYILKKMCSCTIKCLRTSIIISRHVHGGCCILTML